MPKIIFKKIFTATTLLFFLSLFVNASLAQGPIEITALEDTYEQTDALAGEVGWVETVKVGSIVASVIKGFLGLLGIIFVVYIIYAGYNWMTAAGEEEKIRKAKDTIQRAIIGLIIIASAYAITYFVFAKLSDVGSVTMVGS